LRAVYFSDEKSKLFRGMWGEVAGIQAADAMDLRFQG
jgi:hypothetical protein